VGKTLSPESPQRYERFAGKVLKPQYLKKTDAQRR